MDPGDALTATVEASIALAGFSGIVVVLGRREHGEWSPHEQLRLVNLLANGFTALLLSLLGVLLLATSLQSGTVWSICSGVWFAAAAGHSGWVLARNRTLGADDLRHSSPFFYWALIGVSSIALALQIVNLIWLREFWPFFAGIVTSLGLGVRQFVALLLMRVTPSES